MGGSRQWGIAFKWAKHTERSVKITVYGFQRSFYGRRMKKSEWESGEEGYWSEKKGIYKQWFQGHCADWLREKRYTQESSSCALVAAASALWFFFVLFCFTFFEYGYAWSLGSCGVSSLQQQSSQLIWSSTSSHTGQLLMYSVWLKWPRSSMSEASSRGCWISTLVHTHL